jgi:hypothetical protein
MLVKLLIGRGDKVRLPLLMLSAKLLPSALPNASVATISFADP